MKKEYETYNIFQCPRCDFWQYVPGSPLDLHRKLGRCGFSKLEIREVADFGLHKAPPLCPNHRRKP